MSKMIVIPPTNENGIAKIRIAAYCRVSSNHSDQENSYETQVRYFSNLYNNSETAQLVGIYADEGISGTSTYNRTSFNKMMADCRRGKIDRIITKSLSRFARNTKDCLKSLRELKELGISVCFEKENIDTTRMSDEMMITVMGGLAQEESHSISKNVRWGFQKRMASGTLGHARVPYGYKSDKKTGKLRIDKKKAETVRRIFDMYINGSGLKMIANALNSEGIPSPTGKQWNTVTINKMLRQEKYIGDTMWQKTWSEFMGPQFQINRGQQPRYYIKDSHPPIIDRATFELAAKVKKKRTHKAGEKLESPFQHKLICGKCGRMYSYYEGRSIKHWQCSHKHYTFDACDSPKIYDRDVRIAFEALCAKLHAHGKKIFERCIEQFEMLENLKGSGTASVAAMYEEIADLKEQKHRLSILLTKGYITEEKYRVQENEIETKIINITADIDRANEDKDQSADEIRLMMNIFKDYNDTQAYREKILSEAIDTITVSDGELIFNMLGGLKFTERLGTYERT